MVPLAKIGSHFLSGCRRSYRPIREPVLAGEYLIAPRTGQKRQHCSILWALDFIHFQTNKRIGLHPVDLLTWRGKTVDVTHRGPPDNLGRRQTPILDDVVITGRKDKCRANPRDPGSRMVKPRKSHQTRYTHRTVLVVLLGSSDWPIPCPGDR